jgi:hypothetical protein
MCSIAGFIASKPLEPTVARRLCSALLQYGRERGSQSTGIFVNGRLMKRAECPEDFVSGADFYQLFEDGATVALMHTRQPTCGDRGDAQAQPFHHGNTVSVHNGMFHELKKLKEAWDIEKPSGVDSELVCTFVESHGVKKLPKFMESTDGPSAVGILHQGQLYLMRNGNPIWAERLVLANETRVAIFASTRDILVNAIRYAWVVPHILPDYLEDGQLYRLGPKKTTLMGKMAKKVGGFRSYRGYGDDDIGEYYVGSYYRDKKEEKKPVSRAWGFSTIDGVRWYGEWVDGKFTKLRLATDTPIPPRNDGPTLPTKGLPEGLEHLAKQSSKEEPQTEAVSDTPSRKEKKDERRIH